MLYPILREMPIPTSLPAGSPGLRRGLNLPLLALYGLGVTIGAGIYVLVGATAAKAGVYAPVSFLLAAIVVGLTGLSYCELGTRFPVSAGAAAYVREGLGSRALSLGVGLLVAVAGTISAAAVSIGSAAYLQAFVPVPLPLLAALVIVVTGLAAVWGIVESVTIAAVFTLIEIGGLALVIGHAFAAEPELLGRLDALVPPFEAEAWSGIFGAGLLAFFAFIGFEDIANVAEEVKRPEKTLPRGILLTLAIATLLYFSVVAVVVLTVPLQELSRSSAPLALIFVDAGGTTTTAFRLIAIVATLNGVLVQMIMASRVLYGLAVQGSLPSFLAGVNATTRTPLQATAVVVSVILVLALFLPIGDLAELTSAVVLVVFTFVNLALLHLKWRQAPAHDHVFQVPISVPALGLVSSALLLLARLF